MKRKSISKKIRFEVFKRDSFTCQYCGKRAPDVVLVVDHIHPVAKGGLNDLLNLITSCESCNQGKSDRKLDDASVVSKRHGQATALQERREQIEMIAEWQRGLAGVEELSLAEASKHYTSLVPGWKLNNAGLSDLRRYIAKYGLAEVMSCMRKTAGQHVWIGDNGKATEESSEVVLRVFLNALKYKESNEQDPDGSGARYAAGIARNRLDYLPSDHRQVFVDWARSGVPVSFLKEVALTCSNWYILRDTIDSFLENTEGKS